MVDFKRKPIGLAFEFEQVVVIPCLQIWISGKKLMLICPFYGKKQSDPSAEKVGNS